MESKYIFLVFAQWLLSATFWLGVWRGEFVKTVLDDELSWSSELSQQEIMCVCVSKLLTSKFVPQKNVWLKQTVNNKKWLKLCYSTWFPNGALISSLLLG